MSRKSLSVKSSPRVDLIELQSKTDDIQKEKRKKKWKESKRLGSLNQKVVFLLVYPPGCLSVCLPCLSIRPSPPSLQARVTHAFLQRIRNGTDANSAVNIGILCLTKYSNRRCHVRSPQGQFHQWQQGNYPPPISRATIERFYLSIYRSTGQATNPRANFSAWIIALR